MPPRQKKTAKPTEPAVREDQPQGVFARLQAQADERRVEVEPYVINDIDPPIVIQPPNSIEQQIGLSELFSSQGEFRTRDARRVLQLICGDSFTTLWPHIKGKHISFLVALIRDMGEHFGGYLRNWDDGDLPGGSKASST